MIWLLLAAFGAEVVDATGPIEVDGKLNESVWKTAPAVTEFLRFQPTPGGEPTGQTEVRFAQDAKNLYVGVWVSNAGYPIRARVSAREAINSDDQLGLYLDTYRDGRTGYIFYFNALGIQQDILYNDGSWNVNWDTALRSKGTVSDDGYQLEIAIPWRSLRYPKDADAWGVMLTRKIPSEGAKYGHPQQERGHPRIFNQAVPLTGISPAGRGAGLELIPALTAAKTWPDTVESELPEVLQVVRPSLDAKFGITSDIGVAATVNPDFSQVESDTTDVRVNPQFAFQFPERRPFFLDGMDAFSDRQNTLYTRSIVEPLGGLKVSGRAGIVSAGVVSALDRSPSGSFNERGTTGFSAEDAEGAVAETTLVRARAQVSERGAYIGGTYGEKRLFDRYDFGEEGWNLVGGVDAAVPMPDRWVVAGSSQFSETKAPERGSSHEVRVERTTGEGTGMILAGLERTTGFRNELGFVTQSGFRRLKLDLNHTFDIDKQVDLVRPALYADGKFERDSLVGISSDDEFKEAGIGNTVVFGGVHQVDVQAGYQDRREDGERAGGPTAELSYSADLSAALYVGPWVRFQRGLDFATGTQADTVLAQFDTTLRPSPGLRIDGSFYTEQHQPVDQEVQSAYRARFRTNGQMSRTLGLRWVTELAARSDEENPLWTNALLVSWLDVPGTAAYLGVSQADRLDGRLENEARTVFAKVSVLLRP